MSNPRNNFYFFWTGFNEYYAGFETRTINWDSVYNLYQSQINAQTDNQTLHRIFVEMISPLKDPHVALFAPGFTTYNYQRPEGNFLNFNNNISKYLSGWKSNGPITYGFLDDNLGYVFIDNFKNPSSVYDYIDRVISEFKDVNGIIIDVRNNGGGEAREAYKVASRFADSDYLFAYTRSKNGPEREDLSDFFPSYISPAGGQQFIRPIAVLTNRQTGSAAEFMTLMIRSFPYAIHVGDTTGGGIGGQITRELPNGWTYTLSPGICYPPDKTPIEGIGIVPDVTITISEADSVAGTDTILEAAIELLK